MSACWKGKECEMMPSVEMLEVRACYCSIRFLRGSDFAAGKFKLKIDRSVKTLTGIWGSRALLVMGSC